MFTKLGSALLFATLAASAQASSLYGRANTTNPTEDIKITASDGSIEAHFIPFGATLTNFFVKDKHGKTRDIILGFDNKTDYVTQALGHPYFGPIVGRYANRIKNGTFSIPPSRNPLANGSNVFHIVENENGGKDTLHGGTDGFDTRLWNVVKHTPHSVTFTLTDPNGMEGFPATVFARVTYTLKKGGVWAISMHATADGQTPIMLSGHHYWNLEAYEETQDLIGHVAQFPASRVIGTDGILIPTGDLINVTGTPLDFRKAKSIGNSINATAPFQFCGTNCTGFDNCWIYDEQSDEKTKFSLWSVNSGIRMDVTTNQPALQVYSCNGIFDPALPIPRKTDQGGPKSFYENHSCVVVEQESWIDAINQPEWGIDQIFGPGKDYFWDATYKFSVAQ